MVQTGGSVSPGAGFWRGARVPLAAQAVYGLALRQTLKCYVFNSD
jgi:hypothetical protein